MNETYPKQTEADQDIFSPDRKDWRSDDVTKPPFVVAMSAATFGINRAQEGWRDRLVAFAGNMSENYAQPGWAEHDQARIRKDLTTEQAAEMRGAARENAANFIRSCGYEPDRTAIMRPQADYKKPLGIVDVDQALNPEGNGGYATWLEEKGDFIYTRDPEKVLGCRPADCPVLVIKGIDGNGKEILAMLHAGWQELNAGYLEQAMALLFDEGVDFSSLKIYVGPAANKENYPYVSDVNPLGDGSDRFTHPDRDKLFVDVRHNPETGKYEFAMDMPGFINYLLTDPERFGADPERPEEKDAVKKPRIRPEQVAFDGSDVARLDSGHSSNSRPRLTGGENTRDLIIASITEGENPYPANQQPHTWS